MNTNAQLQEQTGEKRPYLKTPKWLRIKLQGGENLNHVQKTLDKFGLTTVVLTRWCIEQCIDTV